MASAPPLDYDYKETVETCRDCKCEERTYYTSIGSCLPCGGEGKCLSKQVSWVECPACTARKAELKRAIAEEKAKKYVITQQPNSAQRY